MDDNQEIEISTFLSEDGTRSARVKKKDNKYVVIFLDDYDGYHVVKKYSHLQLACDQAEEWVL